LFLVLTASVLLLAQGPPPGPPPDEQGSSHFQPQSTPPDPATQAQHHIQFLTKLLALTTAQQQQATTIFTNAATASSALHDQMKTAHQSLQAAIIANNSTNIGTAATTIGGLTTQLVSIEATAQAAFYQILTADQQTTLTNFEQSPKHGHFGGPGGPPMD
jgi:Spy/CpxP family protein refolding chaperone